MSISAQERITLIRALEQIFTPNTFFSKTFFPDATPQLTKTLAIDIYNSSRTLAQFTSRRAEGDIQERKGYITETFVPPYIKHKDVITPEDNDIRPYGDNVLLSGGVTPAQYLNAQRNEFLRDAADRINRTKEYMAAQVLDEGTLTAVGKGQTYTYDFNMPAANKVTLAGNDLWTDETNANPNEDLKEWKRLITQSSGQRPTDAIMGKTALLNYIKHPKVKDQLDNRKLDNGQIDPNIIDPAVTYYGYVKDAGLDIWGYDEVYDSDGAGTLVELMPAKKVFVCSRNAYSRMHYARIENLKVNAAVKMFFSQWEINDPSSEVMMVEAAPLPALHQSAAYVTAQVIA